MKSIKICTNGFHTISSDHFDKLLNEEYSQRHVYMILKRFQCIRHTMLWDMSEHRVVVLPYQDRTDLYELMARRPITLAALPPPHYGMSWCLSPLGILSNGISWGVPGVGVVKWSGIWRQNLNVSAETSSESLVWEEYAMVTRCGS